MPSISTVIACFNGERYLAEAIESALGQAWRPHEVIVVDDGSTDATAEIAATFASAGVICIRHEVNRGVSAARNSGLRQATGEFVAILDSDDQMMPGRLGKQVAQLLADSRLGGTLGLQKVIAEPGVALPDWACEVPKLNWRDHEGGAPFYCASSIMLPRRALEVIGEYDEGLTVGEDIDLVFRLIDAGFGIGTIGEPLILRRVHEANATGTEDAVLRALPAILSRRIARRRAGRAGQTARSGAGTHPEQAAGADAQ